MTIIDLINKYDFYENKNIELFHISTDIKNEFLTQIQNNDKHVEYEYIAFTICENYNSENFSFVTLFTLTSEEGKLINHPNIDLIDNTCIKYWETRYLNSQNPVIKLRYLSLVFEYSKKLKLKLKQVYFKKQIDLLFEVITENYLSEDLEKFKYLIRIYNLIITYNQKEYIEKFVNELIKLENTILDYQKCGLWGYCFRFLINNKKIKITKELEKEIIDKLEVKKNYFIYTIVEGKDNFYHLSIIINFYFDYFNKKNRLYLLNIIFQYENLILNSNISSMLKQNWLQHLHILLKKYNYDQESKNILKVIQSVSININNEMSIISGDFDLNDKEFDNYINTFLDLDIDSFIQHLTFLSLPSVSEIHQKVLHLQNIPYFYNLLPRQIVDGKGRIIANIGNIKDDIEGNIISETRLVIEFKSLLFSRIFYKYSENDNLIQSKILKYLTNIPYLNENDIIILNKSISHYFIKDYISFIHLAIPFIENYLRQLVENSNITNLKPIKEGIYNYKLFEELLGDIDTINIFNKDIILFIKVVLIDKRGYNLRNKLAHGLMEFNDFRLQNANMILHILLIFGQLKIIPNE